MVAIWDVATAAWDIDGGGMGWRCGGMGWRYGGIPWKSGFDAFVDRCLVCTVVTARVVAGDQHATLAGGRPAAVGCGITRGWLVASAA